MIDITVNQTNNFVVPEEDPIVLAGEPGEYNHNSEELVGFDFMVDADLAAEDETDDTVVFGGKISAK